MLGSLDTALSFGLDDTRRGTDAAHAIGRITTSAVMPNLRCDGAEHSECLLAPFRIGEPLAGGPDTHSLRLYNKTR